MSEILKKPPIDGVVSVVMATFNDRPSFLERSLASIVRQTWPFWELIIVDDSTDSATIEVIESYRGYGYGRVTVYRNDVRQGFVESLNRGLLLANGEFIARMDGDDIADVRRLEKQVAYLRAKPEVGIVGSDVILIDECGVRHATRRYPREQRAIIRSVFFRNPLAHPAVMIRRKVLDRIGYYDPTFVRAEDYELWLRAIGKSVLLANVEEPLLFYRVRSNNAKQRDRINWRCSIRAKIRHFNRKYPIRSMVGIGLSLLLYLASAKIINWIYRIDIKKPFLMKRSNS